MSGSLETSCVLNDALVTSYAKIKHHVHYRRLFKKYGIRAVIINMLGFLDRKLVVILKLHYFFRNVCNTI